MRKAFGRSRFTILLVLVMVVGTACGDGEEPAAGGQGSDDLSQDVTLAVGHHSGGGMLPFYYPWGVAPSAGLWDDNLKVEIVPGESPEQMQQLLAGNIEVGHPGPTQVFDAIQDGYQEEFRVVGTWLYRQGFELKVNEASPLEDFEALAEQAAQEKVTVGISEMGGGEVPLIRAAFAHRDLTEGEHYELLPIGDGGAQTAQALEGDQVDAYVTANKDFIGLSVFGIELRDISPEEWSKLTANVVIVRTDVLEQKPEAVVAYLRGLAKAVLLTRAEPQLALEEMKEGFPEAFVDFEDSFSLEWMRLTEARIVSDERLEAKRLFEPDVEGLLNYRDFLVSIGELEEGRVDQALLDEIVVTDIAEQANDFDYDAVVEEAKA